MTKQPLLILLAVAVLSSSATAQTTKPPVEANLYYRALFASIDKMAKSWGNSDDSVLGSRTRTDYHHMIVEKNGDITAQLPSQLGEYRVEYLDSQGLIDRYKKLGKEFSILVARPMENEGELLKISFTVYWISHKKGRLYYGLSDWSNVYFRYDCESRGYVIDEVKLGGI